MNSYSVRTHLRYFLPCDGACNLVLYKFTYYFFLTEQDKL